MNIEDLPRSVALAIRCGLACHRQRLNKAKEGLLNRGQVDTSAIKFIDHSLRANDQAQQLFNKEISE